MTNNTKQSQGDKFEKFVFDLFNDLGFNPKSVRPIMTYKSNVRILRPDMILESNGMKYYIDVKFSRISPRMIEYINDISSDTDFTPIIVTPYVVGEYERNEYKQRYKDLEILDISNLLYFVQGNDRFKIELMSLLPYTVENIEPNKPLIDNFLPSNKSESELIKEDSLLSNKSESKSIKDESLTSDKGESEPIKVDYLPSDKSESEILIDELNNCKSGWGNFRKYEEICYNILKQLFSDDLTLWEKQWTSNKELYRFDLLCRTKDDNNNKTFWSIVENYFKSKYIIFEFKNYTDYVCQKEIYTTEKYLYAKALRSVAIIITPQGYDENACWAAKGCLRENGKLILLLTNDDLIKMLKMKSNFENPSVFLQDYLDALLSTLEK